MPSRIALLAFTSILSKASLVRNGDIVRIALRRDFCFLIITSSKLDSTVTRWRIVAVLECLVVVESDVVI